VAHVYATTLLAYIPPKSFFREVNSSRVSLSLENRTIFPPLIRNSSLCTPPLPRFPLYENVTMRASREGSPIISLITASIFIYPPFFLQKVVRSLKTIFANLSSIPIKSTGTIGLLDKISILRGFAGVSNQNPTRCRRLLQSVIKRLQYIPAIR